MLKSNKPRILIVEDDPDFLKVISEQFKQMGCEIVLAKNGIEALDIVSKTQITVIMSDIYMPQMSGIQLLDAIEQKNLHVPVIVMTGSTDFDEKEVAQHGGVVLLKKPFSRKQLKELAENYIKLLPTG